jgi:uncharacterized tellurite resistance protein B-like protein
MHTYNEKIGLLSEMIAFAVVDSDLHDSEYAFLALISKELGIEKGVFLKLFHENKKAIIPKDEFHRILHFYKLALLMHCDGIIHTNENQSIHEIGLKMGLNPAATKKILHLMEKSPNRMLSAETVILAFQEYHN